MSRHSRRSPQVLSELASRLRGVAREEAVSAGTSLVRFTVVQPSPLVIEEIEGDLVLEEGDPDFTIGDGVRQHIASLAPGDQVVVMHAGGEWHAIDSASAAGPVPAPEAHVGDFYAVEIEVLAAVAAGALAADFLPIENFQERGSLKVLGIKAGGRTTGTVITGLIAIEGSFVWSVSDALVTCTIYPTNSPVLAGFRAGADGLSKGQIIMLFLFIGPR